MSTTASKRIEISIPYYYDPATGLLYAAPETGKPIRTQFFSNEQLVALRVQEKEIAASKDNDNPY